MKITVYVLLSTHCTLCFQLESKFCQALTTWSTGVVIFVSKNQITTAEENKREDCLACFMLFCRARRRVEERRNIYTNVTEDRNLQVFPTEPQKLTRAETSNCSCICHSPHYTHHSPHLDQLRLFFRTVNSTDVQCLITTSLQREIASFITPR